MKPQLTSTETTLPVIKQIKHNLYINYGGMLLGYIFEVVKNQSAAEQCLIDIFNALQPKDLTEIAAPGVNAFCRLQQLARKSLASFTNPATLQTAKAQVITSNKYIELMAQEQQQVFCGIHYQGKTTASLAAELNRSEADIRQLLKESFTVIRKYRNDTAVH